MADRPTTGIAPNGQHAANSVAARLDALPLSVWHRRMVVLIGLGSLDAPRCVNAAQVRLLIEVLAQ
jgi:hypothetical protein